ncbi:MAG: glutamine--fructose-6-phosphate transaminase (isomerizing), partial [Myxococcota bacterium]
MCGIVGYVGPETAAPILLDGLRRLEYRGYDSAGLSTFDGTQLQCLRTVGKLRNLESALREHNLAGSIGIGHTRWATHGRPSEANAHPHISGGVAVVHNGIIENFLVLKKELVEAGRSILSDTDTEIVAHLIDQEVQISGSIEEAVRKAIARVEGAYAIAVVHSKEPDRIIVAKTSSPLVVGLGEDANYCGSDIPALLPYTKAMLFLEDGEMAVLTQDAVTLTTLAGAPVKREPKHIDWSPVMAEKNGYKHFMIKEIFEQPRAIEDTLRGRLNRDEGVIHDHEIDLSLEDLKSIDRVILLACGTSHHAAMVGRYLIEELAQLPAVVELASEFRGRSSVITDKDLVVAVSQSGETLDTLVAAQQAKDRGARVVAIANVIGSALPRLANAAFYTHAGPEIGVASTKCFTTQLANLVMLSIHLGTTRGSLEAERARTLVEGLVRLPQQMQYVLHGTRQLVANLARRYSEARDVLFLGRGLSFPIALEGALKLKEISYVHAEGYAAGEMKHGPIALIDSRVPVI